MIADFYITRLSNDMKMAVQKNHLGVVQNPPKKRRHGKISFIFKGWNFQKLKYGTREV